MTGAEPAYRPMTGAERSMLALSSKILTRDLSLSLVILQVRTLALVPMAMLATGADNFCRRTSRSTT